MLKVIVVLTFLVSVPFTAKAGLDLKNQTEIMVPDLDLDGNGRITREEMAEYLFFYFDHDGNESLTKGEYHRRRPLEIIPADTDGITFIDLNNDNQNDDIEYDTNSFLDMVMIGERDSEGNGIKAYEMMDIYFSRFDKDKSRAIERDEWQKHYKKHAAKKDNQAPKAADNDYYSR